MKAEYIDHMGSDERIADVAWVSTDIPEEERTPERRERLIRFLARKGHWTPFGHCMVTLRMSAPVPITVQCYKHKVGFVENGESRRYVKSAPELYVPKYFRTASPSIKQGSIDEEHPASAELLAAYKRHCESGIRMYQQFIADGVPPEQARFILPQGVELRFVWTGSLYAYARFFALRNAPDAQREIHELAWMVSDIIAPLFPIAWSALTGIDDGGMKGK